MRKLLTLICLFASIMMANAKSVVFTLKNGTQVYYLLGGETNPIMKFVDGKIVVNADSYEFSDIKSFEISAKDDPVAIEAVKQKPQTSFNGNSFVVKSVDVKTVKVYAVNGTEVNAEVSQQDGDVIVTLPSEAHGVFIIRVGNDSFKIKK